MRLGGIDAIIFDLGNTLVPFGDREIRILYEALERVFARELGPMESFFDRANSARDSMMREREDGSMREITVEEFAHEVSGGRATPRLLDGVREVMHRTFLDACRVPDGLHDLLRHLAEGRKLAVCSNYLLTSPIEELLQDAGLWDLFVTVEVSATSGFMKPHAVPFERVRSRLGVPASKTLMVGDNFFADIVGGCRAGFKTALTREHLSASDFDARAPDVRADFVVSSLDELADRS